ncbi:MAG: bifunctional 2-polyprenyl-6-hydroxyphenol methylase/3-demethylubiquinol 3-O-methyltransferase UbiG [Pseudomonadota bacterium]
MNSDSIKEAVPTTNNVDPSEVAKFEELASRWWDTNSEFKPLHDINPLRLNYIAKAAKGLHGKKVLDVGCGGGILAESMALQGANVTGIDRGERPIEVAKLHLLESNLDIDYRHTGVEELLDAESGTYDVVTCMEMLEHVPDPSAIVQACAKMVKPEGHVFFSTINRSIKAYAFAILGAEYVLKMLPKGTHDYKKFIKPSELTRWCRFAGLDTRHLIGMHYNPLTRKYWLGQGVDVNYILHTQKV